MSPLRGPHEFFQEGAWHPDQYGNMVAYGPPHGFRPQFCEPNEAEQAMMERMGIDPRLSPHPGMPPHLRPNGFPYPRPPFHHDPSYPHSPIMSGPPPTGEHFTNLHTVSPAHVPSLSPIPSAPGFPSPDPGQQPPTPASAHDPLMSPHHLNQNSAVFFPGGPNSSCALSSNPSSGQPDSPAPGSSSSSGSILERTLTAKQEPPSPLPNTGMQGMESNNLTNSEPGHPQQPHSVQHHHGHQPDWPQIAQGFGDVNVEEYIKHDFGMDSIEFNGYPSHGPAASEGEQHHQYPHPHPAPVSVGPPWVR